MKTTTISSIVILMLILNSGLAHSQSIGSNKHFESLLDSSYQAKRHKSVGFEHNQELFSCPFQNYHFKESEDLVVLKLDSIIMNEERKSQFTYDDSGNTLQSANFSWSSTTEDWIPTNCYEYSYNENNQIICKIYYEYFPSVEQLLSVSRYEYTFDNNDQLVQMLYYLINDDNVLALASKMEYSYNTSNLLDNSVLSIWDNQTGQWQFSNKDEFEYNTNGDIVFELRYNWGNVSNQWTAEWKIISDYDEQNNLTIQSYYDCFENPDDCSIVWENQYIYDGNSNLILETYFSVDEMSQQLNPNSKIQYSYDTQNKLIEAVDFNCIYNVTPVEWYEINKYNNIYNNDDLISEQTLSLWNFDLNMYILRASSFMG
ncbi:MAG: DUF3836 domain-containing protein [Bacteroidales bacterium]|nr:DUF3836 domain-containing protein [Bacteroidales bacterium]